MPGGGRGGRDRRRDRARRRLRHRRRHPDPEEPTWTGWAPVRVLDPIFRPRRQLVWAAPRGTLLQTGRRRPPARGAPRARRARRTCRRTGHRADLVDEVLHTRPGRVEAHPRGRDPPRRETLAGWVERRLGRRPVGDARAEAIPKDTLKARPSEFSIRSPGDSWVPANQEPIMTARRLRPGRARRRAGDGRRRPPTRGFPSSCAAVAHLEDGGRTAVVRRRSSSGSCTSPGPTPTFDDVGARPRRARGSPRRRRRCRRRPAPAGRASVRRPAPRASALVAVRGVDDQAVDARVQQPSPSGPVTVHADGGRDPQAAARPRRLVERGAQGPGAGQDAEQSASSSTATASVACAASRRSNASRGSASAVSRTVMGRITCCTWRTGRPRRSRPPRRPQRAAVRDHDRRAVGPLGDPAPAPPRRSGWARARWGVRTPGVATSRTARRRRRRPPGCLGITASPPRRAIVSAIRLRRWPSCWRRPAAGWRRCRRWWRVDVVPAGHRGVPRDHEDVVVGRVVGRGDRVEELHVGPV